MSSHRNQAGAALIIGEILNFPTVRVKAPAKLPNGFISPSIDMSSAIRLTYYRKTYGIIYADAFAAISWRMRP